MKTTIIVQNLKCGGCAKTITTKISEMHDIEDVTVDIEHSMVSFFTSDTNVALAVKAKLKSIGYPSINDENSLTSKAKSFVSCATGKIAK